MTMQQVTGPFADVETFLDKEAIAYTQRVGASIRLATTTGYPGGLDAAASGPTAPGPAAPDPAAVFGKVGAGEVLVWGSRNVVLLDCPEASLGFNAESVLPVFLRSFLPNPAIAQEADAMRQNSVIESQQQSAMAQQRQQAQFSAMRQAVNTQRQAIDEYQRAAQARSDAQWAADRARTGHVASDYTWTDGFSDAMRGVNTWVRPDGTEVETSTASDRAWTNAAGDVVGGSGGFDPGAGWTELRQR